MREKRPPATRSHLMKLTRNILFLASAACACALRAEIVPVEKLLGEARIAIIEKATTCSAELITSKAAGRDNGILRYKITSKGPPRELSPEILDTLRSAVLRNWEDDGVRKACMPLPGVRYTFRYKSEKVSLMVCYRCKTVIVEEDGKAVAGRPGDDIAASLREVAASFLTEEEIKNLP